MTSNIICFPDAAWDAPLWTNRQHMMRCLTKHDGFRVLYINPPSMRAAANLIRSVTSREVKTDLITEVGRNLWVLDIPMPLPNRLLRNRLPDLYDRVVISNAATAISRLGFKDSIVWTYSPFSANHVGLLGERLLLYDCVDRYACMPYYKARGWDVERLDRHLAERAHAVLCTSTQIYEEKRGLNPRSYMVGNAADTELFAKARSADLPLPHDLRGISAPIIGFHGALDEYRIDYDLLLDISVSRPDWNIVLIGPSWNTAKFRLLVKQPNIHFLGPKSQIELPAYVARYDVALLPYKMTQYVAGLSPLKVYEYLAAGKPVVSVRVPYIEELGVVRIADNPDAFIAQIDAAITKTDHPERQRSIQIAEEHSWDAKLGRILEFVPELIRNQ